MIETTESNKYKKNYSYDFLSKYFKYDKKREVLIYKDRIEYTTDVYDVGVYEKEYNIQLALPIVVWVLTRKETPNHYIHIDSNLSKKWHKQLTSKVPLVRRTRQRELPKGVSYHKLRNLYQAHVYLDKLYALGCYETIEDAQYVYDTSMKLGRPIKLSGRFLKL